MASMKGHVDNLEVKLKAIQSDGGTQANVESINTTNLHNKKTCTYDK